MRRYRDGDRPEAAYADEGRTMGDEFEFFLNKAWSDGLPAVTPTEARVQRMLTGTRRAPDDFLGLIPPALEPATVRTAAIHTVMAGCQPTYLPVVLGGLTLMLREAFNLNGVQGTMHGVAPLMIVHGPYAQQIECVPPFTRGVLGHEIGLVLGHALRPLVYDHS
jgi:hypothetical protein